MTKNWKFHEIIYDMKYTYIVLTRSNPIFKKKLKKLIKQKNNKKLKLSKITN